MLPLQSMIAEELGEPDYSAESAPGIEALA